MRVIANTPITGLWPTGRGAGENRLQIQRLLLLGQRGVIVQREPLQQITAANDLVQADMAQAGQMLTNLLGQHAEIVHHALRQTMEVLPPQLLVLCCNTGSTIVQVADPQVFAAQGHHGAGAEPKTVRAQYGAFDHVQPGFQPTIDLQPDSLAQAVFDQRLVRLGQSCLPG